MRVRLARRRLTRLLVCAWSVVATGALCGAEPPGRPIQFGASEGTGVSTNLNFATRSDSLNPYSQAPDGPAPRFSNRGSMEGVMVAPLRNQQTKPNKPNKRTKDLLEQRMNWAIMNNEELSNPEEEETIARLKGNAKSEDEQEQEALRLTPEQRLLLGMYEGKDNNRKDLRGNKEDRNQRSPREDDSLPEDLREREESLQQFLGTDFRPPGSEFGSKVLGSGTPMRTRTQGTDFFNLSTQASLPEPTAAQKARMDEFRQILGLPPASDPMKEMLKPRTAPTFNSVRQESVAAPPALSPAPETATVRENHFGLVPSLGAPVANNQLPALPSLTPALPQKNNTPAPPPAPSFLAPKRVF